MFHVKHWTSQVQFGEHRSHYGKLSPGKLRQGWTSYVKMPACTLGSSSIIFLTSSTLALKIPIPAVSLPSEIGQTIDKIPSARKAKFLRPCSQIIFSDPASCFFGVALRTTTQYSLVVVSICRMNSSVIVAMNAPPSVGFDAYTFFCQFIISEKAGCLELLSI